MDWKEFLTRFVKTWRDEFEKLPNHEQKAFLEHYISYYHFSKPCQIEVIDLIKPRNVIWIITRDRNLDDMKFIVNSNAESLQSFLDGKKAHDSMWFDKLKNVIPQLLIHQYDKKDVDSYWGLDLSRDIAYCIFRYNPLEVEDPVFMAQTCFQDSVAYMQRDRYRQDMLKATDKIRSDTEQITDEKLRSRFLEATDKLEESLSQIKRLDEQENKLRSMEKELVGVRKLVGTVSFGEWKVLQSEIDKVNTRIAALSDIRSAYDKLLAQQNEFMKQQTEVMEQQSSVIKWIKYATILLPIAVISVPIIEIIAILIRHFLGIP